MSASAEIRFKRHGSGHCYFTRRTIRRIDAVIWRGQAGAPLRPEDGIEVIATGKLTTYPARSRYQIVVDRLELAASGAHGPVDKAPPRAGRRGAVRPDRKQLLPFAPKIIGVITSPTGAVIRDILHRLEDRFPCHVILWPVPVQGEGAAARIAAAVAGFNGLSAGGPAPRPDLLIVARGGGSIEDLWAFNEEEVVRAVAARAS
jgi:exodeoxyribonuclease VII large subunit